MLAQAILMLGLAAGPPPSQPVDLNHAVAAQLMQLPGVGQKRAQDILAYRSAHPFRRPTELLKIHGFGQRTYTRLKPWIVVTPATPVPKTAP